MRGGVMHVGGEPDHVADAGALDERQQIGDLVLAPLRRAVAERDGILADQPDRQIGRDHLPGRIATPRVRASARPAASARGCRRRRSSPLFQVESR